MITYGLGLQDNKFVSSLILSTMILTSGTLFYSIISWPWLILWRRWDILTLFYYYFYLFLCTCFLPVLPEPPQNYAGSWRINTYQQLVSLRICILWCCHRPAALQLVSEAGSVLLIYRILILKRELVVYQATRYLSTVGNVQGCRLAVSWGKKSSKLFIIVILSLNKRFHFRLQLRKYKRCMNLALHFVNLGTGCF